MKHLGTILGGLALIGVIWLAFGKSSIKSTDKAEVSEAIADTNRGIRLAYVRIDTLQSKYLYFVELSEQLAKEEEVARKEVEKRQRDIQIEVNLYQQEAPKMSPQQRQQSEADLMRVRDNYVAYEEQLTATLMKKQEQLNKSMKDDMDSVLVKMKDELNLDFILLHSEGGAIVYASTDFDITDLVVEKLNENYLRTKTEAAVEPKKKK
jgi:outer membrane protein